MDEKEILKFWKENKILIKLWPKIRHLASLSLRRSAVCHRACLITAVCWPLSPRMFFGRYKTMRGFHVKRRWGWDCHGLPIENMIEKRLGLKSKKDIEAMGVEKFNETCRSAVLETAGRLEGVYRKSRPVGGV